MNKYYPNNRVRISATLTDSGATLVAASSIFLAYFLGPSNVTSVDASSIVNPSTGLYYHDLDVTSSGEHIYRWTSKGTHVGQSFGAFFANSTMF